MDFDEDYQPYRIPYAITFRNGKRIEETLEEFFTRHRMERGKRRRTGSTPSLPRRRTRKAGNVPDATSSSRSASHCQT